MKRLPRILLGVVYLTLILFSLVVLKKPGSAVFYLKPKIPTQNLIRDGNAFQYRFTFIDQLLDPNTILVLEDRNILQAAFPEDVKTAESGSFALEDTTSGATTVLFSPIGLSDPASNGHIYRIYIRPRFFSSQSGKIYLELLTWCLVAFLWLILLDPNARKVLFQSPIGIIKLWMGIPDTSSYVAIDDNSKAFSQTHRSLWIVSVVNTYLITIFFVFMEFIFFVTKPSYMVTLRFSEKILILLIASLLGSLLVLLILLLLFILDILMSFTFPFLCKYIPHLLPAFLIASLSLILFDNFTYTIFRFGIVDSTTLVRFLYALAFIGIFSYSLRKLVIAARRTDPKQGFDKFKRWAAALFFTVSFILTILSFRLDEVNANQIEKNVIAQKRPNIILFGTDGLNADNMSVYGYERDTTPYIRQFAQTSLVSENNFTNAGRSMGSDTAILTGKLPFATRVLYPPDTLKGVDQYLHLPGLLKRNGYYTVQLGVPYYVDANITNFQKAFDAVSCDENASDPFSDQLIGFGYSNEIYLLKTIGIRIGERLGHILFSADMKNPFYSISEPVSNPLSDFQRLECLRTYLMNSAQTGQPLFAHIHLLGTHGPQFFPSVREFSKDQVQGADWMTDFYDDAILDYDQEVEWLVQLLEELGQYDNTILILYTDHGQDYQMINRLPLIIHFPDDEFAGSISLDTQNIDIAPTVLDYMGIEKPTWMTGNSLLKNLNSKRLVISGSTTAEAEILSGRYVVIQEKLTPPFYQFNKLSVIQCQNWFLFDLMDGTIINGIVANYVNPCPIELLDSQEVIRTKVGEELRNMGYNLPEGW